ncbi:TrlF family AAA-like ATPase [Thiohalocapsa sp. ML1]|jgi:energy-coupling factor transporter ATP-binding protein EcfA2|uniref:TrlF family AAA-like ATPase n=1 Tax=Thiohalocapsa sp. ML1 TaxID=1431688 RepID=UPI000731FBD9|nr:AAA family ATPase [Thiohalocapsa sp. ML1]
MSGYQGMRWFKCDLQVQTPADGANWRGAPMAEGDEAQRAAAEAYIRRCYEIGLEVIAVTDHNFLSKGFIPYLQQAINAISGEYGYRLVLFPGFEFEADVGKGCHVLAFFESGADLEEIDHYLTECGVPFPRVQNGVLAKSRERLPRIIEVVQGKDSLGRQRGLVILPHIMAADGLFDTDKISDWLQQEEFLNPDLLAVEVPKPVSKMSRGFQKLFGAGDNCDPAWRRRRSIACVMASDAKALRADENSENPLGKRYTWIKMSAPSIESLRQAFLDHESRIRLPDDPATDVNPLDRQFHARILSLSVEGAAFVEDQEVDFSPNLNCIIGGRGSGKSTLLEYLRLALRKDGANHVQDDRTKEKIQRIRKTLAAPSSRVRVRWRSRDGVEDELVLTSGEASVAGREVVDAETFFRGLPVRFFSQQQLTQLTDKDSNNLLPLIDNLRRAEIDALDARERELRAEIGSLFQTRREQAVVKGEHQRLSQEVAELTRQRSARAGLQAAAQAHQSLQAELKLVERVRAKSIEPQAWVELAEDFVVSHSPIGSVADTWPHGEWFKVLDSKVEEAKQRLLASIMTAVETYQQEIVNLFDKDVDWPGIADALAKADSEFAEACKAQGLSPEEVARVQEIDRDLRVKQADLEGKQRKLDALATAVAPLKDRYRDLLRVWREQHRLRQEAANEANRESAALQQRFLEVTVRYSGDRMAFDAIWNGLAPKDRRTKLAKQWEFLGDAVFDYARDVDADSPWLALLNLFSKSQSASGDLADWLDELKGHVRSTEMLSQWENTLLKRVPDLVDVTLYRADGSRAGSIQDGGLSDGQRNTAALALLLAQGNAPIVIDQPEDELDSSFIYRDLVPMLRRMKDQRQLIFATHNANLPVNGDAELVCALETRNGHGRLLAVGGLDRPDVCSAVLDVMEGSKEAFQRRREKYHF